ncbi:MAG: serine--tRNA ligase [bacterium]
MFSPRQLREQADSIRTSLKKRGESIEDLDRALEIDKERREIIEQVEDKRRIRNEESSRIGELKAAGEDEEAEELIAQMSELKEEIQELSARREELDEQLNNFLLRVPNILHDEVPPGEDEEDNKLVEKSGKKPEFDFDPRPHWDLGKELGLYSSQEAGKLSGSRFSVYHRSGARLERALINFMLDVQTEENGYEEVMTPVLVKPEVMEGTGQLPKFKEDMYQTREDGLYLIPTAEVSLINLYREEILADEELPVKKTAWTPCFRREAGAHGRDTRGLMRQHQFNKVELIKITEPEASYAAHEELLGDARSILDKLELSYRVVTLCAGDTGFAAAKTYDLEVWIPSQGRYREISSCSNCEDFQARRAGIQFRREEGQEAEYCHTLNASGVAVGRCWLALLENYQQKDGSVVIPDALRPYLGGKKKLTAG